MVAEMTDTALKWQGMNVLIQSLGEVDAERFISLMNREPFDYTKWRQDNLPNENVRALSKKAMNYVKEQNN